MVIFAAPLRLLDADLGGQLAFPVYDPLAGQAPPARHRSKTMMLGSAVSISTVEVSVRGVRSPVLTAGPPDGAEAVVFVHGNPGPADD